MGNCWKVSEDRSSLLSAYHRRNTSSGNFSSTVSSPLPTSSVTSVISSSLDNSIPKLVTFNRTLTNIDTIKAAQCRNLLDHLPLIHYNSKTSKQTECAICLIDFDDNEFVRKLPCDGAHVFHPSCIDQWLEKSLTCPHCSTNVDAALLLNFVHSSRFSDDDDE